MYVLNFDAQGIQGIVTVRTAWIVETGTDFPRLVSCYVRWGVMDEIKLLDVVALLEDVPSEGLRRGEVGTIVEVFADRPGLPGAFLVEFSHDSGEAYAFATLRAEQLLQLHHRKQDAA